MLEDPCKRFVVLEDIDGVLGLVIFQMNFLPEVRLLHDLLQRRCDLGVQTLALWIIMLPFNRVRRSQLVNILSSLNFTNYIRMSKNACI